MAGPQSIILFGETMAYENLLYEVKDHIARITFNRPNVLNALNRKTIEELGECLDAARLDDSVRVVILTGSGEKAFIAGADINELAQRTPIDGKDFSLFGQEIIHRLETLGKPSIAAINGFALGGGCELALEARRGTRSRRRRCPHRASPMRTPFHPEPERCRRSSRASGT